MVFVLYAFNFMRLIPCVRGMQVSFYSNFGEPYLIRFLADLLIKRR